MDAQRFDNLAKSLAGRLSRRNALRRAGAAASATLLASAGVRAVPAGAQEAETSRSTRSSAATPWTVRRARSARHCSEATSRMPARLLASSPTSRSRTRTATSRRSRSSAARRISRNSPPRRRTGSHKTWAISSPRRTRRSPGIPTSTPVRRRCSATPVPPRRSRPRDLLRRPRPAPRPQRRRRRPFPRPRRPLRSRARVRGASARPGRGGHATGDSSAARPPMSRVVLASARRGRSATRTSVLRTAAPVTPPVERTMPAPAAAPTTAMTAGNAPMRPLLPAPVQAATARPEPSLPVTPD